MDTVQFSWIDSYTAIAGALRARGRDNASDLREVLVAAGALAPDADAVVADPFTFFTAFNRGVLAPDRARIVAAILAELGLDAPTPADFAGLPTANHELWQYFDTSAEGTAQCWDLFELALAVAEEAEQGAAGREAVEHDAAQLKAWGAAFDAVHAQPNINKANLTRALYWVAPRAYLPLGGKTRPFIHDRYGVNSPYSMTGLRYLRLLQELHTVVDDLSFPEIAAKAYLAAHADSWWPPEGDFDPCLTAAQLQGLFAEGGPIDDDMKTALRRLRDIGGQATPEELAHEFGKSRDFYSEQLQAAAAAVCAQIGSKGFKGSMWPVLFTGQPAGEDRRGDYVWKMRAPLAEAVREL